MMPIAPLRARATRNVLVASSFVLLVPLLLGAAADAPEADPPGMFAQRCQQCHSNTVQLGHMNIEKLTSELSVGGDFKDWQKVVAVLEQKRMPPEGLPQPDDAEREEALNWVRSELNAYTEAHAGDPGRVTVRRLTSGEYAYTIEDLTGVRLDLTRDFSSDAVGGEGFTNFGDVQFMQDARLESYLSAAKRVADRAIIGAGPLQFYEDAGLSGFEMSAIERIQAIYTANGFRSVAGEGGMPYGLEKYAQAFYATWQYRHREALGFADASLTELAVREGVSAPFVEHIWNALHRDWPMEPASTVVEKWNAMPAPGAADEKTVRAAAEDVQGHVINWPRWLFNAGELAAGGRGDERALVLSEDTLKVVGSQKLLFVMRNRGKETIQLHLSVSPVNPGAGDDAVVYWRNPAVSLRGEDREKRPEQPFVDLLTDESRAQLDFDYPGLDAGEFVTKGEVSLALDLAISEDDYAVGFTAKVEVDPGTVGGSVLRVIVSDKDAAARGRSQAALLANVESPEYAEWRKNVLEFVEYFPQISHGEPTPSDKDPIPAPYNNVYNQPERDIFHQRVKYYRLDDFIVEHMLNDRDREALDQAWSDLYASFGYHDAYLHFVATKFDVDLGGKTIADLNEADVAAIPAEPRQYVARLYKEYNEVQANQRASQQRHLDDVTAFAARAWRRPLSKAEEKDLRSFYHSTREKYELDHSRGIRALIARVLVSPAFLYRFEEPKPGLDAAPLSDAELASRLSYFLWSSAPDEELLQVAAEGKLTNADEVERQVRRMLADPKARRFATEFFGQWLGFYRFDQFQGVDPERFPEFTPAVKAGMYDEAVSFFEHVVRKDRPVKEIFFADYTFLNQPLAKHYGVDKPVDSIDKTVLVRDADEFQRGGMMRLGAVLTATSAPLRTSPVKRGDWLLRRVLGTPTPPPPADAGEIAADPSEFAGKSIREQLAAHQQNPTCAACHSRIDPLGFPLERYDPVGRWRTAYEDGKPIDDASKLADSTEIEGIDGLLEYLGDEQELVLRNLTYKMLGYALGRTVAASDQPLIDELAGAGDDATFADLAVRIAQSRQFLNIRGEEPPRKAAPTVAADRPRNPIEAPSLGVEDTQ